MSEQPSRLLVGQIGKPHGIQGEVYVVPISDDPSRFEPGSILTRSDGTEIAIESMRGHGSRLLVRFRGVSTRDDADALRGPLYVARDKARSLEDDEYWPHDLIGCSVVEGDMVHGSVTEVRPGAAHDLLVIDTQHGERMIPLVKEIVIRVSLHEQSIEIAPPAGLLD